MLMRSGVLEYPGTTTVAIDEPMTVPTKTAGASRPVDVGNDPDGRSITVLVADP